MQACSLQKKFFQEKLAVNLASLIDSLSDSNEGMYDCICVCVCVCVCTRTYICVCARACTELKIMVCHRSFCNPFWYMTDQIQFGRPYFTVYFQ